MTAIARPVTAFHAVRSWKVGRDLRSVFILAGEIEIEPPLLTIGRFVICVVFFFGHR